MEEARSGTGGASSEFSRAESIIEALGNQLVVLDEAQENGRAVPQSLGCTAARGRKPPDEDEREDRRAYWSPVHDMKIWR